MSLSINNLSSSINTVSSLTNNAVKLAADLKGGNLAGAIKDVGQMFKDLGALGGGTQGKDNVAQGASLSKDIAKLFGNGDAFEADNQKQLAAAKSKAAAAKGGGGAAGGGAAGGAGGASGAQGVAASGGAGGTDSASASGGADAAGASSGADGGAPMSLGALLALVGGILVKSIEKTMKQLADAAKQLDAATTSGGPTAAMNQKIQELTFNLQQIQQTLNRVNETVTNLSRSQSEAQKATAQNLSV